MLEILLQNEQWEPLISATVAMTTLDGAILDTLTTDLKGIIRVQENKIPPDGRFTFKPRLTRASGRIGKKDLNGVIRITVLRAGDIEKDFFVPSEECVVGFEVSTYVDGSGASPVTDNLTVSEAGATYAMLAVVGLNSGEVSVETPVISGDLSWVTLYNTELEGGLVTFRLTVFYAALPEDNDAFTITYTSQPNAWSYASAILYNTDAPVQIGEELGATQDTEVTVTITEPAANSLVIGMIARVQSVGTTVSSMSTEPAGFPSGTPSDLLDGINLPELLFNGLWWSAGVWEEINDTTLLWQWPDEDNFIAVLFEAACI